MKPVYSSHNSRTGSSFILQLMQVGLVGLICASLLGCQERGLLPPTRSAPPPVPASEAALPDWLGVYFTAPDSRQAGNLRGGLDARLAQAILAARLSVDMAAMDLDLWSLRDALITAYRRGVIVRLVVESDYLDTPEIQELVQVGISVLGDRREGLMHNKFVVIDRTEVWTGSANFTLNGMYRNDNNILWLRSSQVAANYTQEFEEMFVADQFGPGSPPDTPYPRINLDGVQVEVYFSPEDRAALALLDLIAAAERQVYFMLYAFTSDDLAAALVAAHRRGVEVSGVLDSGQIESNLGGEYSNLVAAGIPVRRDGNPDRMHHKVMLIDGEVVITGSYNFSQNAETRNDENIVVVYDSGLAQYYQIEFERVFAAARP